MPCGEVLTPRPLPLLDMAYSFGASDAPLTAALGVILALVVFDTPLTAAPGRPARVLVLVGATLSLLSFGADLFGSKSGLPE